MKFLRLFNGFTIINGAFAHFFKNMVTLIDICDQTKVISLDAHFVRTDVLLHYTLLCKKHALSYDFYQDEDLFTILDELIFVLRQYNDNLTLMEFSEMRKKKLIFSVINIGKKIKRSKKHFLTYYLSTLDEFCDEILQSRKTKDFRNVQQAFLSRIEHIRTKAFTIPTIVWESLNEEDVNVLINNLKLFDDNNS